MTPAGVVTTLVGNPYGNDPFIGPFAVVVAGDGTLYVLDGNYAKIFKVTF